MVKRKRCCEKDEKLLKMQPRNNSEEIMNDKLQSYFKCGLIMIAVVLSHNLCKRHLCNCKFGISDKFRICMCLLAE